MMNSVHGLHHITAIAGPAQENLDFYAGVLGMRLVKRSINQDDPGTYHLFYADAEGHPGHRPDVLPVGADGAAAGRPRSRGRSRLEVPAGSLGWWGARLENYGVPAVAIESALRRSRAAAGRRPRHAARARERARPHARPFAPRPGTAARIPVEQQIRGLYGAQVWERQRRGHGRFMAQRSASGARPRERVDSIWLRDLVILVSSTSAKRHTSTAAPGASVPCITSLVRDGSRLASSPCARRSRRRAATPPRSSIGSGSSRSALQGARGRALRESQRKGPGFAVDENPSHLGETLVLPPWFESSRAQIDGALPPLTMPVD